MSSVRGTIAVDVVLTDSTSTSGGSSLNTITLRDATEYTSGKVAIVSGTVGSGVVTIQRTAVGYVNSLGESVSFSQISRVALKADAGLTLFYRTAFPAVPGPSASGGRVAVADVPTSSQTQTSFAILMNNTNQTATYTLVLYGT
jgi:hypothetical protein